MKVNIINLNQDQEQQLISIDVDPETQLGTLKSLIEVELNIPILRQNLVINGKVDHDDNSTLQLLNVKEHDIIGVRDRRGVGLQADRSTGAGELHAFRQVARSRAAQLIEAMSNPENLQHLEQHQPALADAVRRRDVDAVVNELVKEFRSINNVSQSMRDPLSVEGQQLLMDQIRQEAVDENRAVACEVLPESFGDVVMLFIRVEVNNTPVMAFVDSGAQSTIMSEACAQRCAVDRIIDRRYQGTAKGVGSARIVGRIHLAQIKCGGVFFPASFTILENQQVDLLFGLDLLRRHQCCIDLKQGRLLLGSDTSVPFLSEAEIREGRDQTLIEHIIKSPTARSPTALGGSSSPDHPQSSADKVADRANALPSSPPVASRPRDPSAAAAINRSRRVHTQDNLNYGGQMIEEAKVKQLTDLGFDRIRVQQVLRECRGDTELAAARLAFG